jgi:starch-binding outer membrane protein, SusD/RagB family
MEYCEAPLVSNGPSASDSAVYKQALTKFNDALTTIAAAGASAAIKNWALAGRARTNLFLGNYDAAAADAAAVPAGFAKQALFSTNSSPSFAGSQLNQNRNRSGTLRRIWWPLVDTSNVTLTPTPDQYVKDPWTNTNDTRMAVLHTKGLRGVSNQALYYGIQKYKDYTAPITMTSKREMNLIQAEVYWKKGDLANAVATLNINRTAAGLPAFVLPLSSDDVFQRLLSERFAELFVEGHRMTDLNRFNLVGAKLGTGRAVKYQLTLSEILNNTSMTLGTQSCPGKS